MIKNSINHLAIIMDGNGRWAKHKNQPRTFGHKYGAQTAKKIINDCVKKENASCKQSRYILSKGKLFHFQSRFTDNYGSIATYLCTFGFLM